MKRPAFANGEVYHVYNRGIERRRVFMDERDHHRFVHDLYEFNDTLPASNTGYHLAGGKIVARVPKSPRQRLVDIFCFCLMPDHFHLLLRQRREKGITEFMRKLGTGYTNYFNQRYQRIGPLFQGKFKAVHVTREAHLLYLPHYIHLNPLDLWMPEWRRKTLTNVVGALNSLASYRWSSYLDYIGKKNFPALVQSDLFLRTYRSPTSIGDYRRDLEEWLRSFDLESMRGVVLESIEVGLR